MFSVPALGGKKVPNYPYLIDRSLRFRSPNANSYCSRTFAANPVDRTRCTISLWARRGRLIAMGAPSDVQYLLSGYDGSSAFSANLYFSAGEQFGVTFGGAAATQWISTKTFNAAAWHHFVVQIDTTQANAQDRIQVWIDGVKETPSTFAEPALNALHQFCLGNANNRIGTAYDATQLFYDGYIAEMHFLDGIIAPYTSFGQFYSPLGGIWVPKAYAGSYGTNGFYLSFNDNTSLATLGNDDSPNSNNWSLTGFSLALSYLYDSVLDTPTDTFSVFDPSQGAAVGGNTVLRDGNLTAYTATSGTGGVRNVAVAPLTSAAPFPKSGKWYWESPCIGGTENAVGLNRASDATNYALGADGIGYYRTSGQVFRFGSVVATLPTWTAGDIIMVAADCDLGLVWFGRNSVWGAGDPAAGTGAPITGINFAAENWCASVCDGSSSASAQQTINFGQQPWLAVGPPTGFLLLSWQSLNGGSVAPPVYPESVWVNASVDVTGTKITVNFSQALSGSVTAGTLQYRLNAGASINVTAMTVSGSSVTGTLPTPAQQGQTVQVQMQGNTTLKTLMTGNAVADFAWSAVTNNALPLLGQGNLNVGNVNNLFWGKTEYPGYGSYSPSSGPNLYLLQTDYTGTTKVQEINGADINGTSNIKMIVGGSQATLTRNVIPGQDGDPDVTWYGGAIGDVFNLVARAGQNLTVQILPP